MEAPVITRQRRPFLAPLWGMGLVTLALIAALVLGYRSLVTTTFIVVRHAEKELSTIEDPPLAPDGELRAERLSQLLGSVSGAGRVAAIYVTDTRRTQMTAAPLAARLRITPVVLPADDPGAAMHRAEREHRGGAVLLVAHSDTVPEIVGRLSGLKVAPIADDEYDNLYIVGVPTLGKASVVRLKY